MATSRRTRGSSNGIPVGDVTPEEAAKIRAQVSRREQAPSSRSVSLFENWRDVANQLGDPFEVERIAISKLRQMRRDPMLGFGLSFIKTPIIRAKWFIDAKDDNGPNAQIAAHLDHDLRRIYPSFVLQWTNALDFGFQAIAKRFELRRPSGTYTAVDPDTGEESEEPIWSEGNIDPIAWKPFIALSPEAVEPIWNGQGEFNGISYRPGSAVPAGIGAAPIGNSDEERKIDLAHSLWVTNERDSNFGSVFGYPRLGYAYKYWWSYWFRWAIADRAFEKKGDPSVIVYHPEGEFIDEQTGERLDYGEYALLLGERMRSGGVLAIPSAVYEDANGRGTIREWEVAFTKDATDFDPFDKSFDYLDIQKLRSLWIPEQAFLEGKGGTSSRNVAAEMGESFIESQAVLAAQVIESINRWVIPQWIAVNYPEFLEAGGTAKLIMHGFADQDVEFTKHIIQMVGQQPTGADAIMKLVDLKRVLQESGTPIASFAEQQRRQEEIAAAAAAAAPPATAPVPGEQVGVVPTTTGFSYIAQRGGTIHLADTSFADNLPDSPHYSDKTIRRYATQLHNLYRDLYRDEYETAIEAIENGEETLEASETVELAAKDWVERATKFLSNWAGSPKWTSALERSREIFGKIARRASRLEAKRVNISAKVDEEEMNEWVVSHLEEVAAKAGDTTRKEVRDFIASKLQDGITDRKELARLARERFADYPDWKADRLVRTEVRDFYNAGTIFAAKAAGLDSVQAEDGRLGDTDKECMDRNGKIFKLPDALKEREHPNGTLSWRIIPAPEFSIEYVAEIPGLESGKALWDEKTQTVLFRDDVTENVERQFLLALGDHLERSNEPDRD